MAPANICAGFKACGVYPFDPQAIKCTDTDVDTSQQLDSASSIYIYISKYYIYMELLHYLKIVLYVLYSYVCLLQDLTLTMYVNMQCM